MPVFNEQATAAEAISSVLGVELPDLDIQLTIVESGSTDGTTEIVRGFEGHERVRVVYQDRPRGKGNAVREGISESDGKIILIQDADLEYSVSDYGKLIAPIQSGQHDFVIGTRDAAVHSMRHFPTQPLVSKFMNVGHVFCCFLFNKTFGTKLHDPFSMYKVFRRECIEGMRFRADRFDFDWELAGKLVLRGYEPVEIPVSYESRSFHDGKKVRLVRDPLTWAWACLRCRAFPGDWELTKHEEPGIK